MGHGGKVLDVLDKAILAAGDKCGLCGDHNRMRLADIKSSTQCIHTSLLSMAYSFRVNNAIEQCTPPAAAETKDILRRVHLGQECRELTSMAATFSTRVHVAKQCTRQ